MIYQFKKSNIYNFILLVITVMTVTATYGQFEIKKHTVNSGGTTMMAGSIVMHSSIGQVDASNQLTSDSFVIKGGFWQTNSTTSSTDIIFTNSFENL